MNTEMEYQDLPRVMYAGSPICTRGEYGESVEVGRVDPHGYVWVWDATYGWCQFGRIDDGNWIYPVPVVDFRDLI